MRALVCLFVLVAGVAAQSVSEVGKAAIDSAYDSAEQKLREALGGAHPSVRVAPRRALRYLKNAAREDIGYISSFGNGPNVEDQINFSVKFWSQKFKDVIQPYLDEPQKYKNLIIDHIPPPRDPKWNTTDAYRSLEARFNALIIDQTQKIKNSYISYQGKLKAREVEEATYSSWARFRLEVLLKEVERSMINYGQYAKTDAANGRPDVYEWFHKHVRDRKLQFDNEAEEIFKEYEANLIDSNSSSY